MRRAAPPRFASRGAVLLAGLLLTACTALPAASQVRGGGQVALPGSGQVEIPVEDGALRAQLAMPPGPIRGPAVVALHGCGGPFADRDKQWRDTLTAAGHIVLFPDSFGSRGLGSQCSTPNRTVTAGRIRRSDAIASATWLAAQPFTPPGGVVVLGWSDGGSTVVATAEAGREGVRAGLIRGFVAFYPGCRYYSQRKDWRPSAPMLIVMGEADDWTPAAPCHALAEGQELVTLVTYPGAYHDFDVPGRAVSIRRGLSTTANGDGVAHTGTDPAAREDVLQRVPAFIAGLPPAK